MNLVFMTECAVDRCYKKSQKGKQMCKEHQKQYDDGEVLTAFYGKKVKKRSINKPTQP